MKTHQGIDVGGKRACEETLIVASKMPNLKHFSIVGHSLGGLFARYCVGCLEEEGFFDKVQPMNFVSMSSPHLGSRRVSLGLRFSRFVHNVLPTLYGATGAQLMLEDGTDGVAPILLRMSDPESSFYRGLKRFRSLRVYAIASGDLAVPYSTAAIVPRNPYRTGEREMMPLQDYPHIIDTSRYSTVSTRTEPLSKPISASNVSDAEQKYDVAVARTSAADDEHVEPVPIAQATDIQLSDTPSDATAAGELHFVNDIHCKVLRAMLINLRGLPWHRVDVMFNETLSLLVAHDTIIAKRKLWGHRGADIVQHMVDKMVMAS
eukprot:TRINITY_DN4373_c0_g1_i2.p1 TRINITY_DN4373_c0_g1~~TRINITY_DN4373_c0_g1_i2.p1  ORF type:complete len:319 (+),score=51.14 TRINITY_DN4373_c0_g1_i2:213-1169(+)